MANALTLTKLHDIVARLALGETYTGAIGSIPDDGLWSAVISNIKNGNAILIVPGPGTNQVTLKPSSMIMDNTFGSFNELKFTSDTLISGVTTPPVGARLVGNTYFFSERDGFDETVVLLAGRYNHIYVLRDTTKPPNNTAIGVAATETATPPDASTISTHLGFGDPISERQAMCRLNAAANLLMLTTFPAMVGQSVAVFQDAPPTFATWDKNLSPDETNAIRVQFTFPPGAGTGTVGEVAIRLGADIIGYLPIAPQLLKDPDIEMVLRWNLMIGEPGAFI